MAKHELCRRDLLKSAGAAAVALSTVTAAGCASTAPATAGASTGSNSKSTASPNPTRSNTVAPAATASPTPAMQRAEELLGRMTIEEKAMQLSCVYPMGLLGAEGPIRSQLRPQCSGASPRRPRLS